MYICPYTYTQRYTHTDFKKLPDTVTRAGKFKIHSAGLQGRNSEAGVCVVALGQNVFSLREPSALLLWPLK